MGIFAAVQYTEDQQIDSRRKCHSEINLHLTFVLCYVRPDKFVPIFFDEAGHRVATQYLLSALKGKLPAAQLKNYRVGHAHLPGHPELHCTPGVEFSSGRLGHMWPLVNGVAIANPGKIAICLGSDGSQQEGNDAEAARLAAAKGLNVKVTPVP